MQACLPSSISEYICSAESFVCALIIAHSPGCFTKDPKVSARISGWLATLIEYPIVIEYVCGSEYSIADALSRLDSVAVDNEVPAYLARHVPSFSSLATQVDRLKA